MTTDMDPSTDVEVKTVGSFAWVLERLDPNEPMFAHVDLSKLPTWRTGEVAKSFFHKSTAWMRWHERNGHLASVNGEDLTPRAATGAREYTLADIERVAHNLFDHARIDLNTLHLVLAECRLKALGWGVPLL